MRCLAAAVLLIALASPSAHAEVASAGSNGFEIRLQRQLAATPAASYRALAQIGRWKGNEVEHGRVIHAVPGQLLRLNAPLGPLQAMAVNGVLTFEFAAVDGGKPAAN